MNVIVGNRYRDVLANLQIDVIKSLTGEFQVDDLLSQFTNFFFGKLILDITAIKDYQDIRNIQKISINLDAEKIILLLDDKDQVVNSSSYLSKLVSMGIYNFTTNLDGINYLLQHPNSYKDVANLQNIASPTSESSSGGVGGKVLAIKNLTEHAGATSLIYMLKKELSKKVRTLAIEINKNDFVYYNDKEMISVKAEDFAQTVLRYGDYKIILVDVNDSNIELQCSDTLYLLEASTIKLNKLLRKNVKVFEQLRGKKIVLNNSTLSSSDVNRLAAEAGISVFYNIPPQNDRNQDFPVIIGLLMRLGIFKSNQPKKEKGLFKF